MMFLGPMVSLVFLSWLEDSKNPLGVENTVGCFHHDELDNL